MLLDDIWSVINVLVMSVYYNVVCWDFWEIWFKMIVLIKVLWFSDNMIVRNISWCVGRIDCYVIWMLLVFIFWRVM